MEIDYSICPYCGDDNLTSNYDDWIYDYGYSRRYCEACNKYYKVYFELRATRVETEE